MPRKVHRNGTSTIPFAERRNAQLGLGNRTGGLIQMFQTAQQEANQRHRGLVQRTLPTHRRRMIRALIVEDDLDDVELCLHELKRAQFAISADVVKTRAAFIERLQVGPYDVVLATSSVDGWTGLQVLSLLQEDEKEIPFILVTKDLETETVD